MVENFGIIGNAKNDAEKIKVGIAGLGVVGGALSNYLKTKLGIETKKYDPGKELFDDLNDCDIVFCCVPAPTITDGKNYSQDLSAIHDVISKLSAFSGSFIVRSTVIPGTCDKIDEDVDFDVYFMPEYLTERNADETIMEGHIVLGAGPEVEEHGADPMLVALLHYLETASGMGCMVINRKDAELSKYVHNAFLAQKVHFFNVVKEACEQHGHDYEDVINACDTTGFVGIQDHTQVPGPDGLYGYGGKCFPKDVKIFYQYVKNISSVPMVVDLENGKFRNKNVV